MRKSKNNNDKKFFKNLTKFYSIYLQHKKNNSRLGAFLILISQLQILSYIIKQYSLFWEVRKETWDELFGMTKIIYNFQNILLIGDIFDIDGWESFYNVLMISLIICCCCVYLIIIFLLLSIHINFKKSMNAIKYLIYIPQIYEKFLFFPINYILAKAAFNPDQIHDINDNIGFVAIILIIIIFNIFLVVIFCIGSSTLIELKDISCTKGITIFIMDIIYKVLIIGLTIWYDLSPEKIIQWIMLFINLIFMAIVYYITYKKSIFNNSSLQTTSLMIRITCCIYSMTMITSGNSDLTIDKINLETFLIFWIILSILACIITFNMVTYQRRAYAIIFDDEIKDEKDFIDKIIYLYKVFTTTNRIFYIFQTINYSIYDIEQILAGYRLSFQRNNNKQLRLSLENSLTKINDDCYLEHFMILFELIKHLGQLIAKKFPNYYIAKLFIANFFIDNCIFLKYTAGFLYEINTQPNHNFMIKGYIKYLTKKLESHMMNKYKKINKLNIEEYMKEIKLSQKIETMMQVIIQDQLKFWDEINAEIILAQSLLKYAITCYNKTQKVHKVWEYYNSTQKFTISTPYLQYYLFHLVTNIPSNKAEIYLKQYEAIAKKIKESTKYDKFDENSLRSPNNVIIIMAGNLSSLGKIVYCSRSISSELNHDNQKIIGTHVGILMPKLYQDNHDFFIKKYYDTGKSLVLNKCLLKPIVDGNGYIKPMLLNITIYSCLKEGLVFLAIMKPSTIYENIILLAPDGELQGVSKEINGLLELNNNYIKNYVYDFCEEFKKIQLVFNFFTSLELIKHNMDNQDQKMRIFSNYEELIVKYNKIMPEKHHIDSIEIIRKVALQPKQDQYNLILEYEVRRWEEYDKWHHLYEEFRAFGKLIFIPKHDKTKLIMMKCNIRDEFYQSISFLRLILIDKIDIEYYKPLKILEKSDDLDEGLKHIPTLQPLTVKKISKPILNLITLNKDSLGSPQLIRGMKDDDSELSSLKNERTTFFCNAKNDNKILDCKKMEKFEVKSGASTKKIEYIESKIELAYKHNHIDFTTKVLLIGIMGYFLTFLGLDFYMLAYKQQFGQDIIANSEIMFTSSLALRSLYDITNICTEIYGIQMGYIRNDIYAGIGPDDLADYDIIDVKSRSKNYQNYVSTFSKYIYRLDKSLQDRIFQSQIRFYQIDLNKRKKIINDYQIYNILSAASLITETFIQIGSIPYEERFNLTYHLYFLINNAFDDLYSANQLMNIVIQETIQNQFEDAYNVLFTAFIFNVVISGMLFIYFIWQIVHFNAILRNFIFQTIRISRPNSTQIVNKLKKFNDMLKKGYKDQYIKKILKKSTTKCEKIKKVVIQKNDSTSFNQIRFSNTWQVKYIFFFWVMVSFMVSYYAFIYFDWSKQMKAQSLEINRLIFLSGRYTNLSVGIATCYIYILSNNSYTFRGLDMGPEMETIYKSLSEKQGFYDLFLQENKKQFEYEYLLQGNYCAFIIESNQKNCVFAAHQAAENGIINMDSLSSTNLQLLKDMFDQSNRSKEAIIEIMNGSIFVDTINLDYNYEAYAYIDLINAIKKDLDKLLLEQTYLIIQILLLIALFYGSSMLIFRVIILKILLRFYSKLKKVMRMFPTNLILSDQYLRIFLIKISYPILGSIQNKLH